MAYSGWLIKVGNNVLLQKKISADSYKVTYNSQDLDSYRDANGLLHRNALEHRCAKVEFETVPMMTNSEMESFMSLIRSQYTNALERKASVTVYIPETDSYVTQDMYMSDPEYSIYGTYGGVIHYDSVRLAFIAY